MVLGKDPPRVAVEDLWPRVDQGLVPVRRSAGEIVDVYADVFADGTAGVRALLRWKRAGERNWTEVPMLPVGNDRWHARFAVTEPGEYRYTVEGWIDPFLTWRDLFDRRIRAGSVEPGDLEEGAIVLGEVARRIRGPDANSLKEWAVRIRDASRTALEEGVRLAKDPELERLCAAHPERTVRGRSPLTLSVTVDPPAARHSAWYELFPRSTGPDPGRPGTFEDLRARLPYIADLGFDVVYLTPIHPIGRRHRRGPNNTPDAPPDAPGSPWAIGSEAGGHRSVDPALGTIEDFRALVEAARGLGLEVALDLAFQCSPDHPWVSEHPTWFRRRPDGSIRTAENPPKRYDDIYPIDFSTPDWKALWRTLKEVVEFWADLGVRWFRVDNPHTKPFEFWRWLIAEVRRTRPEVLFLAEAFTRPKVMYRLAKVGFTHSYTYFAWRTTRAELVGYFEELGRGAVREFFRPHLWPNTPDILTAQFHSGQRSVFVHRLVLAATLSSHYGIYGPAYELGEHVPLETGKEEYRDSEKYAVRHWPLDDPRSLAPEVARINRIRHENPALREGGPPVFHGIENEHLVAYSRRTVDGTNVVLVVVNLDPDRVQTGVTNLDLAELGVHPEEPFDAEDLWSGETYRWQGPRNFVRLDPARSPVHVLRVRPATTAPGGKGG